MSAALGQRRIGELLTGAVVLLAAIGFLLYAISNSGRSLGTGASSITLTAKFDRIDGLQPGADVRIGGVKIGSVVAQSIDPATFLAVLRLRVDNTLRLPADTSAEITSESLLGGKYVALVPGGGDEILADGGTIGITQSAVSLEALLGRFIFSVTDLAASKQQDEGEGAAPPATPSPASPAGATPRGGAPARAP